MGHGDIHIYNQLSLVAIETNTSRNTIPSQILLLFWRKTRIIHCLLQLAPQSWPHQIELVRVLIALTYDSLYGAWYYTHLLPIKPCCVQNKHLYEQYLQSDFAVVLMTNAHYPLPVPTCTTILTTSNWIGQGFNCIDIWFSIWGMVLYTFTTN